MKIIRSKKLGYCMGVQRAVNIACKTAETEQNVWTFGELIHNSTVLADLKNRGINILYNVKDCPVNATVILCAHGVSPKIETELKLKNVNIVDATCPMVKKSQLKARQLACSKNIVFLAGEKNHSEINGIKGYNPNVIVISNPVEAREAAEKAHDGCAALAALIAQTTISNTEYNSIAKEIKKFFPSLKTYNTICNATKERQDALRTLCKNKKIDAIIIAGGKNSSNTKRLFHIAMEKKAYLVENASELPSEIFLHKTIGISAGASTPREVIENIEIRLRSS
jgi:4-hydroxy-3-methylbut-2-enyl diphosphate reductase